MKKLFWILALAAFFGRFAITPRLTAIPTFEGSYEAFTHLLAGFLIGVSFYDPHDDLGPAKLAGRLGWSLAAFELIAFCIQKAGFQL